MNRRSKIDREKEVADIFGRRCYLYQFRGIDESYYTYEHNRHIEEIRLKISDSIKREQRINAD